MNLFLNLIRSEINNDDLKECFILYSKYYDKMKDNNYNINEDINEICMKCSEVYKINDLKLNFIIMVGLFKANAFVTPYNEQTAFYFLEKMPSRKHINILLAHEITHLFQFSQLIDENCNHTLADSIFADGLACFASSYLCPGYTLSEYICMEDGLEHWISECNNSFNHIKLDIINNLENTDYTYCLKYFAGYNTIKDGIPTRIGYLIGYYVIEYLNKKYSLAEMITWQQEKIIKELKNTIVHVL